jgi:PTH1 family peptidyl-tRNA hydrolase
MIVFGLGNPGFRYRGTRHNAGYMFVERLAKHHKKRFQTFKEYKKAILTIYHSKVILIKPICYMNESGSAVQHLLSRWKTSFMVVIDDINLPLGRIRLREKGSDGGHRGLRSIIETLGHDAFPRLRIGIGRTQEDPADHVLSRFSRGERKIVHAIVARGIEGFHILLRTTIADAQNYINSLDLSESE